MAFEPFNIVHIDTGSQLPFNTDLQNNAGNKYVVLWWKNYPLGHLFLNTADKQSVPQLMQKTYKAIYPAISFYSNQQNVNICLDLHETWLSQDQHAWNRYMGIILTDKESRIHTDDISVVICTRNRADYLRNCLIQLHHQKYAPKEIIVVDNAPDNDGTKQVVNEFPDVQYCLEPKPGLDFARNAGAKKAAGNIIAYTDDDALLHPLWTFYTKQAFNSPDIMAVTGLIIAAELKHEAQMMFETKWSFNRGYIFKEYDKNYFNQYLTKGVPVWEIGAGANMAFRKEIFERIGYFDERLDVGAAGCSGDSEFWYRILANGYTIKYSPLAIAYHFHRKDLVGLKKQIFYYMRGFTVALYIQYERFGHAGNLSHLYKNIFPYYLKKLPRAIRHRFHNRYATFPQEVAGIFSGIRFYYKNKTKNRH